MYSVSLSSLARTSEELTAFNDALSSWVADGAITLCSSRPADDNGYSLLVSVYPHTADAASWLAEQFPEQAVYQSLQHKPGRYVVVVSRHSFGEILVAAFRSGKLV